jgi:phosphatidylglycerol:prolipoprotein diacylglycerol transferase
MEVLFKPGYLDPSYGNIRISQVLALLLILGAITLIIVRRKSGLASAYYHDPIVTSKPERNGGTDASTAKLDDASSNKEDEASNQKE